VQAVEELDAAGDQVTAEARAKNCAFVLFTTVTEAHNEGGASGKPGQTTNIPEYHTTVEYKLYRSRTRPLPRPVQRLHKI
jgi:hypothetical protein